MSLLTHAGNEVGNGGPILISLHSTKPVFFDAWETENRYGFKIIWPGGVYDELEVARTFVVRLEKHDPRLMKELLRSINSFHREVVFTDQFLPLVFDLGTNLPLPPDIKILQLIIQKKKG